MSLFLWCNTCHLVNKQKHTHVLDSHVASKLNTRCQRTAQNFPFTPLTTSWLADYHKNPEFIASNRTEHRQIYCLSECGWRTNFNFDSGKLC